MISNYSTVDGKGDLLPVKEVALRLESTRFIWTLATNRAPTDPQRAFQNSAAESSERAITLSNARMEKVANIKKAIGERSYSVASADVAQKLLSKMLLRSR
jgi:anti-sigma28 factor (negative regulator of flagellin synthesis)